MDNLYKIVCFFSYCLFDIRYFFVVVIIDFLIKCIVTGESLGSVLGGYLFDSYGGVWSFRFFAYLSATMCCVNILSNITGFTKNLKTLNTDVELKKTEPSESNVNDKIC